MARIFAVAVLSAAMLLAQREYEGGRPPKADTPYLIHADHLIETEVNTASQRVGDGQISYLIPGDKSIARTPLASPVLVVEATGMDVRKLQLFRLEVKNGEREVTFHKNSRGGAVPLRTAITPISGTLYQIEVIDSLASGEYALSPDGRNDVFCFEVF